MEKETYYFRSKIDQGLYIYSFKKSNVYEERTNKID